MPFFVCVCVHLKCLLMVVLLCGLLVSGRQGKGGGEDPEQEEEEEETARPQQALSGSGFCKWFNVRMGFGFISMTSSGGSPVEPPLDVFVHQVSTKHQHCNGVVVNFKGD